MMLPEKKIVLRSIEINVKLIWDVGVNGEILLIGCTIAITATVDFSFNFIH